VIAAFGWFVTSAVWGYVALLQYRAHLSLVDAGLASGLFSNAIGDAIASAFAFFIGLWLLQGPGRRALLAIFVWGLVNVSYGIAQLDRGNVDDLFLVICVVAAGIAAVLSLAARPGPSAQQEIL
jgi:hypothetical protein